MEEQKPIWGSHLKQFEPFLPFDNPTFDNPDFCNASYRVLIVRLSPFRDVDRSISHLFLFQEIRRALPRAFIDLAFFPSAGERALFEREDIPTLIGVQSLRPAEEFDLLLISNSYTLELINLPYLLIRSGIPLFSSQRGPEWPIIILGGSNAMATQSIIREDGDSLVDGIFFGEGEGLVSDLVRFLQETRFLGKNLVSSKRELLEQAVGKTTGFWAAGSPHPTPLDPPYEGSGYTQKAVLLTPEAQLLPVEYPILNSPEAHTANLHINYGCPAFCSFCFEGYDRKPYRELALSEILSAARQIKQAQGVEELNLYSFNFNTHQDILEILLELHRLFDRVSFKSQRLDVLQKAGYLLEAEVEADKRNFTLGIEGISERLRAWLHKSLATKDITTLLNRLLALKVRRVKLFYVLTGYETDADIDEFRRFLKQLKEIRRSRNRRVRIVFSFGLLIRMPFTPLRYDRLFLDEQAWRPLIGQVKSACETNGFEFRLAFDWPTYCVTQVLAMGGYWLVDPVVGLSQKGYCFDTTLPPEYWDELKGWMEKTGHWNETFLGEKGPDYPFALEFVRSNVSADFLYRQYREAQPPSIPPTRGEVESGTDGGYCSRAARTSSQPPSRGRPGSETPRRTSSQPPSRGRPGGETPRRTSSQPPSRGRPGSETLRRTSSQPPSRGRPGSETPRRTSSQPPSRGRPGSETPWSGAPPGTGTTSKVATDSGYCLGSREGPGRCLGCGACLDEEQRRKITHHQIHQPERGLYMAQLQEVMTRKRRLQPVYFLLRLDPLLAGVLPEFLNAFVFKEILARHPELVDNLLSVRESLFTMRPNNRRFPTMSGETVFAMKAWDIKALETRFCRRLPKNLVSDSRLVHVIAPAEGFTPGVFTRLHLDVHLPADFFPEPRVRLEQYLRGAYVRYSLRREGSRYRFDLPHKALKKKILFDGFFEPYEDKNRDGDGFFASLDVGPKFDLMAFLQTFGGENRFRHARARVSGIEW